MKYGDAMKKHARVAVVLDRIKLIMGLLLMALMAYTFTFYLDSDIGVVICAFLILAPLISFLLAWYAAGRLSAKMEAPDSLTKGKHFTAAVTVTSEGKLPVPFLRLQMEQDANFEPDDARILQSAMTSAEPLEMDFGMTALYAGNGLVSVGNLVVSDYLGLFAFRVKNVPAPLQIGVIPAIPSLTGAGVMLHAVSDIVLTQDDEEEESAASFSTQTMPGYIHRDYVPGDNLRRINWKLSAKRNKLMVRMDEAAATVRPTVILDLQPEQTAEALKRREILMEGALGFLMLLVRQGIVCSLRFAVGGAWKCLPLENEDAVRTAAVELAAADFVNDGNRTDPAALQEHAGAYMVYTSRPDDALSEYLRKLHDEGYVCLVVPELPEPPEVTALDAMWMLSEDFSMTALRR